MSHSEALHEIVLEGPVRPLADGWVRLESFDWPCASSPSFREDSPGRFSVAFRDAGDEQSRETLSALLASVTTDGTNAHWLTASCSERTSSRLDRFEGGRPVSSTTAPWYFSRCRDMENWMRAVLGDLEALRGLADRVVSMTASMSDRRENVAEFLSLAACVAEIARDERPALLSLTEEEYLLLADGVQEIRDESSQVEREYSHELLLLLERLAVLRRIEASKA
jgi:hypothetical protein